MGSVPLWGRPLHIPTSRRAEVAFLVFHDGPLATDVPFDAEAYGLPDEVHLSALRSAEVNEQAHAQLFQEVREGAARVLAEADLGPEVRLLSRARMATSVTAVVEDPKDLGYLQAAWAYARWLAARGGILIQDLMGSRWFTPGMVMDAGASPLDVRTEIRLVFDGDQLVRDRRFSQPGRVLNTRGMKKFGRPDVVAVIREDALPQLEGIFLQIVNGMAEGWMPEAPRHGVEIDGGPSFFLCHEDSAVTQGLLLHNDAVVMRDVEGEHLAFGKDDGPPAPSAPASPPRSAPKAGASAGAKKKKKK